MENEKGACTDGACPLLSLLKKLAKSSGFF
jgi:hypothetical protein